MILFKLCLCLLVIAIDLAQSQSNNQQLVQAINNFGINLYKELIKLKNENLICSGYSANVVLNMVLAGAGSTTKAELRRALGYDAAGLSESQVLNAYHQIMTQQRAKKNGYELDVANSMWIQQKFDVKPEFKKTVESTFYAEEQEVDFKFPAATDSINSWVSKETKGKIPKLFDDPLDTSTIMVLANAVYFKGTWVTKFDKKDTENYNFQYNNGNSKKSIPMMNVVSNFPYTESSELNAQVLELPYDGKDVSMFVFLPKTVDGLNSLQQKLTQSAVTNAIGHVSTQKVHVKMPKFDSSSSFQLTNVLQKLGIKAIFNPDEADLSGIDGKRDLSVSTVVQKAIIEVNEEGTVAAAATGAGVVSTTSVGGGVRNIYFTADHPFVYFIIHKPSGLNLFSGQFVKL